VLAARRELVRDDDPEAPPAPPTDVKAWAPLATTPVAREYIRVDVVDHGPGLSADVKARLFQKFSRDNRQDTKGIGLGLYISREIVERHDGTIWVDSEPGQGATFSFRIPAPI
jgi:signal transduction histidine kinase